MSKLAIRVTGGIRDARSASVAEISAWNGHRFGNYGAWLLRRINYNKVLLTETAAAAATLPDTVRE